MGIIMGALGGLGAGMSSLADSMIQTDQKKELLREQSDLDLQRQKALEDYKAATANQQRAAQASRIGTAAQGIVGGQIAKKYAGSDAAVAAADAGQTDAPLTDEQRSVIAQAKGADRDALLNDPKVRTMAAIQTGDISPVEAAKLSAGEDKLAAAAEVAQMRADSAQKIAEIRAEAMQAKTQAQYDVAMAKMQAAIDKAGKGNTDFDKKIALLKDAGATPKDIANFVLERKQPSLEDLANGFLKADPNAGTKRALTPEEALDKARTLRSLTKSLSEEDPTKTVEDANRRDAATKPTTLSTLPPGARQIGTSGGKPVYETPDGKRFIQQ